jgi:thymidylate synthase
MAEQVSHAELPMKDIPVLHVEAASLARAYEKALLFLFTNGTRIRTQYDRDGDPPSIDATMNITVTDPWSDPMIHKAFPGGIGDLREYVMELQGSKDHWMKCMDDPHDTRWEYTYHWRLRHYGSWKERGKEQPRVVGPSRIDQVEHVIEKLIEQPFTRQAQMITWMPGVDLKCYDPPCLQSLYYRVTEDGDDWCLSCNVRFRSNDAWAASFMNMFGFIHFNRRLIADEIARRTGRTVRLGRLNWHADSYHIYGKDIEEFKKRLLGRIDGPFEGRVYNFFDPDIQEIYREAEEEVRRKIAEYDSRHSP